MINTGSSTEHSVHRTSCPSANRPSEGCGRFSSSIFSKHDSLPATTQGAVKICRLPSAEGQGLRARWRTWAARRRMASVTVSSGPALPAGTPMDASSRSGRAAPGRPPSRPPASRAAQRPCLLEKPRRPSPRPRPPLGSFLAQGGVAVPGARRRAALLPRRRRAQEPDCRLARGADTSDEAERVSKRSESLRHGPRVGAGGEGRGLRR